MWHVFLQPSSYGGRRSDAKRPTSCCRSEGERIHSLSDAGSLVAITFCDPWILKTENVFIRISYEFQDHLETSNLLICTLRKDSRQCLSENSFWYHVEARQTSQVTEIDDEPNPSIWEKLVMFRIKSTCTIIVPYHQNEGNFTEEEVSSIDFTFKSILNNYRHQRHR